MGKKEGFQILYYSCPQIWAWHYSRIHAIKRDIDHMAVLFPFEKTLYEKENQPATYVGHPLTQKVAAATADPRRLCALGFETTKPIIALLPGSRKNELKALLPLFIDIITRLSPHMPDVQWMLPMAPNLSKEDFISNPIPGNIILLEHQDAHLIQHCQAAVVTSGTATLEVALHQVPLVIVYKTNPINYWIAKKVIKVPYIGLCNLIAKKMIAKEFIQHHATAEAISAELEKILTNTSYRQDILEKMQDLKAMLGKKDCAQTAADVSLSLIK